MNNESAIAASWVAYNTRFDLALKQAESKLMPIVSEFGSDSPVENYQWLGEVPAMERWVGDRVIHKLRASAYEIRNYDWANGIELSLDDFRNDKGGKIGKRIAQLALQGKKAIEKEIARVLNGAFGAAGGLGYDGQYLIDTDHVASTEAGVAAQSNSGGTAALDAAAVEAGIVAMSGFKDSKGEPADVWPTHLVIGPANWPAARALLETQFLAGGASNLNYGLLKLIVSPRITSKKWFLIDMSQGVGPIILQTREAPHMDEMDNSVSKFMRKTFYFGASANFGVGPGLWQTIYGSNAT